MKKLSESIDKYFEELNKKFPDRRKVIHKKCCKYCPSNTNISDPETEEYKKLPKDVLIKEYVFVCAWRQNKLCKGICNQFDIDQEAINKFYANE